jgi:hypothetical protein
MSGAKVVLALFGAVLAIALIVVAAFLLTDEAKLLCVEGELQDNQIDAQGQFIPRTETFATIEEAEAFVCKHLPRPRDTEGLALKEISVTRTSNLGGLIEGGGAFSLRLGYSADADGPAPEFGTWDLVFEAFFPPAFAPDEEADGSLIQIDGREERLSQADSGTTIAWEQSLYAYRATASLTDDFDLDRLVAVLESVR